MQQFIEYFAVIAFVAVYFLTKDVFLATAVLLVAITAQVAFYKLTKRPLSNELKITFWISLILGGMTLVLRDETFIQWKPTIVNWFFSLALIASHFISDKNLLHRMLGPQIPLPLQVWRNLNFGWALGFFIAGALNLFVAYYFSLDFWVSYKLIGGFAITFIYIIITVMYLAKAGYLKEDAFGETETGDTTATENAGKE